MSNARALKVTTPSDREVVLTRAFAAPRPMVFDALTRPELLKHWLEAPGRSLVTCEIDLRVGGAYRFVWSGPGKRDVGTQGVYREIVPGERLVHSESWLDWDAGETLVTTILVEEGGTTTLATTVLYPSQEVRDAVMKAGIEQGSGESYDRLAQLLASTLS